MIHYPRDLRAKQSGALCLRMTPLGTAALPVIVNSFQKKRFVFIRKLLRGFCRIKLIYVHRLRGQQLVQ
jgi:hypothetical protein